MATIAAGASAVVSLVAGKRLVASGSCVAAWGRPLQQLAPIGRWQIGPFRVDFDVSISALEAVTYDVRDDDEVRDADGDVSLTALQAAAIRAQRIYARAGTLTVPLGTLTGATAGLISAPGLPVVIPAGMLSPSDVLYAQAFVRKRGATAAAAAKAYFGPANSTADPVICDLAITNVDKQDVCLSPFVLFSSKTAGVANLNVAWNSSGSDRYRDIAVNLDDTQYLNIGITGGNAADAFDLIAVRVWAEKTAA